MAVNFSIGKDENIVEEVMDKHVRAERNEST